MEILYNRLFINGKFCESCDTTKTFETLDPYTGRVITNIPQASPKDVDRAVLVAREAFKQWSQLQPSVRGKFLIKLGDLIEQNAETIAKLDTLENGITINEMMHTAHGAAEIMRYYGHLADKIKGETIMGVGNNEMLTMTVKDAMGICAIIIPWNSPTLMMAKTMGPALAAGNTVILKPAEQTSLSALFVANLTVECGMPPGVFNVLTGDGAIVGAALARHMDIDKITFTGSTEVGQSIMEASARSNLKRCTLELGGKSPLVVFDDTTDVEQAARLAFTSLFVSNGQVCCCGSRTYVQETIYDRFVEECVKLARQRKLGDPLDSKTEQGPQLSQESVEKVMSMIQSGIDEGARLMTGGKQHPNLIGEKLFIEPTVFADVTETMTIGREEIFGPVQSIIKFRDLDDVIERANKSRFGLASAVLTTDINKALRFARAVQAGTCWVNCFFVVRPQTPFGGYKMSGMGREFGEAALNEYLETKTITINLNEKNLIFG